MARVGARKSLPKPAPKARAATESAKQAEGVATAKSQARKKSDPGVVAPKPTVKAVKASKPAPPAQAAQPAKAAAPAKRAGKAVKATKAAKPSAGPAKAVKVPPAKAVNVSTKAAPATGNPSTRKNAEVAVEAPKAKRAGTATKAPVKVATAAAPDRSDGGFPPKTLEKLRKLLEEERETYLRQARDLAAEAEALAADREPGDTQFDEESGEGDTLNVERERDLALSASAIQAVEDIDAALSRMDTGTYGYCERCGKKIAVARLEALPFAALCIECKSREERRR